MEVKIGVQHAPRELVLDSAEKPEDVAASVEKALAATGKGPHLLSLLDERGRRVIVPVEKLAYVEIAEASPRKVGFVGA